MLTEMLGKGGQVCQQAREGQIRCPLIIRPTSEDAITGQLFGTLRAVNPRWWLPNLLNEALGEDRFRQQVYRGLNVDLWQNQPSYPRRLLPYKEGSTQVDAIITWKNPPTVVFIEMKYRAKLSAKTTGDDGRHGYPSDQLIRNIRVGLLRSGWFRKGSLFNVPPQDFVQIVISPKADEELVEQYRDLDRIAAAIPHFDQLRGLPKQPFVGQIGYREVALLLKNNRRFLTKPEQILVDDLSDYLHFKLQQGFQDADTLKQQKIPPS